MLITIIYFISVALLFVAILLCPKSQKKTGLISWIILGSYGVFLTQTVTAGILNLLHIGPGLGSVAAANFIVSVVILVFIVKKGIQAYTFSTLDLANVLVITAFVVLVMYHHHGIHLDISYASVDGATHAGYARVVASSHTFPTNMFFSALQTGLLMEAATTLGIGFSVYKIFVLMECIYTLYSALLFWCLIRRHTEHTAIRSFLFLPTLLYWCGYPLYTTVFGFSYFGCGVSILNMILLLTDLYMDENYHRAFVISALNSGLFSIFVCYTMFVPIAFFGLFITLVYIMWKKERKKLFSLKNALTMIAVFALPSILGLIYSVKDVRHLAPGAGISRDGGGYFNLYSDFILLIPLAVFGLVHMIKSKKPLAELFSSVLQAALMAVFFIFAMQGRVSSYYYMKNNNLAWLLLWVLVVYATDLLIASEKVHIITFYALFLFILLMCRRGDGFVNRRNARFIAVPSGKLLNIYSYTDAWFKAPTRIPVDMLDLYHYVYDHTEPGETICVNDEMMCRWFKTLTGNDKEFSYGTAEDLQKLPDEKTRYMLCVYSNIYNQTEEYLTSSYSGVVYRNSAGYLVRISE